MTDAEYEEDRRQRLGLSAPMTVDLGNGGLVPRVTRGISTTRVLRYCPECRGLGWIHGQRCAVCGGEGFAG